MKALKSLVERNEKDQYKTADTLNLAGGKAWTMSNKARVEQLSMTGTLGHSFYANQKDAIEGAIDVIKAADATILKDAIIRGRNEGYVRAFNILSLVYLSQKDPKLFQEAFSQVIHTGNDMMDFIQINDKIKGFGRSVKKAMHNWLETKMMSKIGPYYALKYRNEIANAIRMSRFKGNDPIYKFVLGSYLGSVVKGRDGDQKIMLDEKDIKTALKKYPKLKASEDVLKLLENDDDKSLLKAAKLIDEHDLDVETLMGKANKFTPEIWDEIAKQSPTMRFMKYLDKFDREGVFDRQKSLYKEKLTVENLKKAKVFPFRLYIAFKNLSNQKVKNHLADVLNDYVKIYDWDVFNKHKWVVAPDVSGSMCHAIQRADGRGASSMSHSTVAGMFAGFFYKGLEDCEIIPWDSSVRNYNVPRADSVITHINAIENANGGSTFMEAPIIHMLQRDIKADVCLFITDGMEWGSGWLNAWAEYKKRNPKAKAFLLRIDGYAQQPFSEEAAEKFGIYQIGGWSDNVVSYLEFMINSD